MRAALVDPWAGSSRPRTPRMSFAGDAIPALADLLGSLEERDEEDPRPVRALVVGVDAQAGGIRGVHAAARCLRAVRVPEHLPQLRHPWCASSVGASGPSGPTSGRSMPGWCARTRGSSARAARTSP